ncbi:MAG: hypothetical protein LBV33_05610 [Lachnospiraceae bacterium]|nr:hypothetical protein [Lachnospiraceae bacterium]
MSAIYLQLQKTTGEGLTVQPDEVIVFDQTLIENGIEGLGYDQATGYIEFLHPGKYFVNWYVVMDPASTSGMVGLSLEASMNGVVTSGVNNPITASAPTASGQVSGTAIIEVEEEGTQLCLRNGAAAFILANVNSPANITVYAFEAVIPVDPDDDLTTLNADGPSGGDRTSSNADDGSGGEINLLAEGDTPGEVVGGCGTIVNFSNGGLTLTNPLTWPIILDVLQISWINSQLDNLNEVCTPTGLENLLGFPAGILNNILVAGPLSIALSAVEVAVSALSGPLFDLFEMTTSEGLISMDAYIGHSTCGIVPAIAGADIPVLSLVAGPPYPQIISRDGVITAFAAEYDALAEIDVSLINLIPGAIHTVNTLILGVLDALTVLVTTIGSLGSVLLGLGAPLPSDYADRINNLLMAQFNLGKPQTNHHMHAVLWHGVPRERGVLGSDVDWSNVADADLGALHFIDLAPISSALSLLGDVISAGGNVASSLLTLLSSRGTVNQVLNNSELNSQLVSGLTHPITAGDYLMVQFTLVGSDNTTLVAGVLASNLMASVTINGPE